MKQLQQLLSNYTYLLPITGLLYAAILMVGQLTIVRDNFVLLLSWIIALHILYALGYLQLHKLTIKHLLIVAAVLRIFMACTIPTLSDDVYRFIWDGKLLQLGYNPMLSTPNAYIQLHATDVMQAPYYNTLHSLINHPQFYTCYPPLNQLIFWVSATLGGSSITASIIIIKVIIAVIDVLGIYIGYLLLVKLRLNGNLIYLYACNPMVIIEGSGNAHFEVVQVALVLMAWYYIYTKQITLSAISIAMAVLTKLIPILLIPFMVRYVGLKKGIQLLLITAVICIAAFVPFFYNNGLQGFMQSLDLYVRNFEFNASIYNIAKQIGWYIKGYNYISVIGPVLMLLFVLCYTIIYFKTKLYQWSAMVHSCLLVLTIYYALATTVHPWYIINLVPLAILSGKHYPILWLAAASLSYNAYSNASFTESVPLLIIEYSIVIAAIIYSYKAKRNIIPM